MEGQAQLSRVKAVLKKLSEGTEDLPPWLWEADTEKAQLKEKRNEKRQKRNKKTLSIDSRTAKSAIRSILKMLEISTLTIQNMFYLTFKLCAKLAYGAEKRKRSVVGNRLWAIQ